MPWNVRVRRRKDVSDETWRVWIDVAIRLDEAFGNCANEIEDPRNARSVHFACSRTTEAGRTHACSAASVQSRINLSAGTFDAAFKGSALDAVAFAVFAMMAVMTAHCVPASRAICDLNLFHSHSSARSAAEGLVRRKRKFSSWP
jgi:hypothetical protein